MTIMADETLKAIYFLSGHEQDWMAGVSEEADGTITIRYRFRYYTGDQSKDAFDDGDRKSWHGLQSKDPALGLQGALDACEKIYDMLIDMGYCPPGAIRCKLIRRGMTHEQFMHEFMRLPFVHAKKED